MNGFLANPAGSLPTSGASTMWKLRLQYDEGSKQLEQVDPESKLEVLLERIQTVTKVEIDDQQILCGYPLKPIDTSMPEGDLVQGRNAIIKDVLRNFETVVLRSATRAAELEASIAQHKEAQRKAARASGSGKSVSKESLIQLVDKSPFEQVFDSFAAELESALKGHSTTSKRSLPKALHNACQNEMELRMQERIANNRYQASLSGEFEFYNDDGKEQGGGRRLGSSITAPDPGPTENVTTSRMKVMYFARDPHRKQYQEYVPKMPEPLVVAVLESLANDPDFQENLKPDRIALVSPRVFWNLVYICRNKGFFLPDRTRGVDMTRAVEILVPSLRGPGVDTSFLRQRRRVLSEKAMENLKRKREYDELDEDLD